jgi:hypothetical protein
MISEVVVALLENEGKKIGRPGEIGSIRTGMLVLDVVVHGRLSSTVARV